MPDRYMVMCHCEALATAANELAERIFATSHPIYAMLFDLQALDVVRIIEGRE